jgi:hypothetical protein
VADDVDGFGASAMSLHLTSDWNPAWDGDSGGASSGLSALFPVQSERHGIR